MGTPFFGVDPRPVRGPIEILAHIATYLFSSLAALLAAAAYVKYGDSITQFVDGRFDNHESALALTIIMISVAYVFWIPVRVTHKQFTPWWGARVTTFSRTVATKIEAMQAEAISRARRIDPAVSVLSIDVTRDEAGIYLRFLNAIASIPSKVLSTTALMVIGHLVVLSSAGILAAWLLEQHRVLMSGRAQLALAMACIMFSGIALVAITVVSLLPILVRGHSLGFGRELPGLELILKTSVSSKPFGVASHDEYLLRGRSLFRHSSYYTDPVIAKVIGTWLDRLSSTTGPGIQSSK
jgi:hypothetical protein